ncbi:hypothetical protein DPMN_093930 [Dreissena polymorpha]|uniref:Uncharacterized protein n=1 Tax=Dreissena polymorpha TaxID=45954 RepID=A0A9D4L547_DREPO|nr:hypothetical protein DPMN_093930 [Dreissena polymorpha]
MVRATTCLRNVYYLRKRRVFQRNHHTKSGLGRTFHDRGLLRRYLFLWGCFSFTIQSQGHAPLRRDALELCGESKMITSITEALTISVTVSSLAGMATSTRDGAGVTLGLIPRILTVARLLQQ